MTYAQSEPLSLLCFTLVGAESLNLMEGSLVEIKLNVLRVIVRVIQWLSNNQWWLFIHVVF